MGVVGCRVCRRCRVVPARIQMWQGADRRQIIYTTLNFPFGRGCKMQALLGMAGSPRVRATARQRAHPPQPRRDDSGPRRQA
jgi:hypothetical protein